MIVFSENALAVAKACINNAGEQCVGLRLFIDTDVDEVGMYRYQLQLERAENVAATDVPIDIGGKKLFIAEAIVEQIDGVTFDYVYTKQDAGFVAKNVRAASSCSDEIGRKVQQVLERQMPPIVKRHGGWLELVRIEKDVAFVRAGGACQGCLHALVSFAQGPAAIIVRAVPEINRVIDLTPHDESPFVPLRGLDGDEVVPPFMEGASNSRPGTLV